MTNTAIKKVSLGECCEITSGSTPKTGVKEFWEGDILWATPKDLSKLDSKYIKDTSKKITQAGFDSCSTKMLPSNSVLLSSRAPIGYVAINTVKMCTNQGFKNLIPYRDQVLPEYLYYWLKAHREYLQGLGNGATFKEISKSIVERIEIPLPSLDDQQNIVQTLDKADTLRQKRKQAIELLGEYSRSTFIEMFGDPVHNLKEWEKKPLAGFGQILTGNTPSRSEDTNYSTKHIEWIKTDNIKESEVYVTEAAEFLSEKGLGSARYVMPGAVLIACIAGSANSIGRVAMTDRKVSFNQQINAIQPNSDVDPIFLYWLIKISKRYILSHATSGMKKILTKGALQKIIMILPPIKLQNQFARKAESIETVKQKMINQSQALDYQFQAQMQKAFKDPAENAKI